METYSFLNEELAEKFEFRSIHSDEANQAAEIENICFPPNEACSESMMKERVAKVPDLFLVAVDRKTGKIAGFFNGIATNEEKFRDEFFTNADINEPDGKTVMLLGLDVLPEYRGHGLARELVNMYIHREAEKGRMKVILTCLDNKIRMYEKMGFHNDGVSDSVWGGEVWYDMSYEINR